MTRTPEQTAATIRYLSSAMTTHELWWSRIADVLTDTWGALYRDVMTKLAANLPQHELDPFLDQALRSLIELRAWAAKGKIPMPPLPGPLPPLPPLYPHPTPRHGKRVPSVVTGDPMFVDIIGAIPSIEIVGAGGGHGGHGGGHHGGGGHGHGGHGHHGGGRRGHGYRPRGPGWAGPGWGYGYGYGELADLGALQMPALDGFTVDLEPGDKPGILRARICVDGKCYTGTMNLNKLAGAARIYHEGLHAQSAPVKAAGAILVGALLEEHQHEMIAGWWSSVKGLGKAAGSISKNLKKLKGPIATAAGIAAGAAAMAVPGVGPALAPVAGNLAHSIVNAAAGSGSAKAAAQQALDQANVIAKDDPRMAKVLDTAHKAVAEATSAYHIAQTVADASAGNADALQKVADLAKSADAGDAGAMKALQIAQGVTSVAAASDAAKAGAAAQVSGVPAFLPFALGAGLGAASIYARQKWLESRAKSAALETTMPPVQSNAPGSAPMSAMAQGAGGGAGPAIASGAFDLAPEDPIYVNVAVADEDGNVQPFHVYWPTRLSAAHFGRPPDLWLAPELDSHGGNVFLWVPKGWSPQADDGTERRFHKRDFRYWRPTWTPTRHATRPRDKLTIGSWLGAAAVAAMAGGLWLAHGISEHGII